MANIYTIRIDHVSDDTPTKLRQLLDHIGGSHVVVTENGSKTGKLHYQGWIQTDMNISAIRKMRERKMPENNGRDKHSIAVVKVFQSYKQYICKGESPNNPPKIFSVQSLEYTSEKLLELHKTYWESRPKTATGKMKNTMKCTMDEVVYYFGAMIESEKEFQEVDVMKRIVEANLENGRPIFDHVQVAMFRNVMCRLYPYKYAVDYAGSLLRKSRNIFFE